MKQLNLWIKAFLLLVVFWILLFDFQRLLFSIHNLGELEGVSLWQWLGTFFYSLRLDLAAAGYLSLVPMLFLCIYLFSGKKWTKKLFTIVLLLFATIVALIHAGEINAYPEWKHKLTSRVFMHLSNPDEVARTADYSMTIWYIVYALIEIVFAFKIQRWLFKKLPAISWKSSGLRLA